MTSAPAEIQLSVQKRLPVVLTVLIMYPLHIMVLVGPLAVLLSSLAHTLWLSLLMVNLRWALLHLNLSVKGGIARCAA